MPDTKDDWRPPVGTRVYITPTHRFHGGKTGTVVRHDSWLGRLACAVRTDDGMRAGVQSPNEINVIKDGK